MNNASNGTRRDSSAETEEEAENWISENITTGILPSEMLAAEGCDLTNSFLPDSEFSQDILSVSSNSDGEDGRYAELLRRPKTHVHQDDPLFYHVSQRAFCGSTQKLLINGSGPGPKRYVINSNDLGTNNFKVKLPGWSEDLNVRINAHPQFANDSSKILERVDLLLRNHHEQLEQRVMKVFDQHLSLQ